MRHAILIGLLSLLSLLPLQTGASDRAHDDEAAWHESAYGHDHELAREARERGETRPIAEILHRVGEQIPGQVIGLELERERRAGQPVLIYELKILTPDGRRLEVEVDARDGAILELEDDD